MITSTTKAPCVLCPASVSKYWSLDRSSENGLVHLNVGPVRNDIKQVPAIVLHILVFKKSLIREGVPKFILNTNDLKPVLVTVCLAF